MFATLLGGLPAPDDHDRDAGLDAAIERVIRAQEEAGLEPLTDGRLRDPRLERVEGAVSAWRFAAGLTDRAVKQALPGPYTLGRLAGGDRATTTLALADDLRREIEALATAGCPLVEIEESDASLIGEDEAERRLFREAHARLTHGATGTHLSLSIVGKSAADAGIETILAAPYASLAVDLINGPDNWNLVTRAATERGIVAGALGAREAGDEPKELLLWAAHYAAATAGRGIARVGLGSAGSWANLTWAAVLRKLERLGDAARLAALPRGDQLARQLDPRAVSIRTAALGHDAPKPPSTRKRRRGP